MQLRRGGFLDIEAQLQPSKRLLRDASEIGFRAGLQPFVDFCGNIFQIQAGHVKTVAVSFWLSIGCIRQPVSLLGGFINRTQSSLAASPFGR